jgi:hypothetical protein
LVPGPADDLAPTAIADAGGIQQVPGILTAGRDVAEVAEALHGTRSMARDRADGGSHPQRRQSTVPPESIQSFEDVLLGAGNLAGLGSNSPRGSRQR